MYEIMQFSQNVRQIFTPVLKKYYPMNCNAQKQKPSFFLVDKMTHMVGSYAPKESMHSYTTPMEDAPSGMAGRGTYHVSSLFCDDDKNEHLKWEWTTEIKKDWK